MRIQVTARPEIGDGRAHAVAARLRTAGFQITEVAVSDVYLIDGVPAFTEPHARELFCDAVAQHAVVDGDRPPQPPAEWDFLVEVGYKPAVADPVASSIRDALGSELGGLPRTAVVQTARQFFLRADADPHALARELYNPLIQHALIITRGEWDAGTRPPALYPTVATTDAPPVERIDIASMTDAELEALSRDRLLALTLPEMQAIRDYYADAAVRAEREALGAAATDVELEMIAQTWSEHCKHKIFAARVEYREGDGEPEIIDSLYKTYIKATTERVGDPAFVKSVFHDNAGVVKFDDETLVCFKAETHNSPSALDPYGGAITGIVGVNRDILGTGKGARPIFNTDVLCFGYPDTPAESLPEGLLHPRVVMEGVHRGIVDGGNQSGIPTAAGAFLFDESYTGKPLVFCGTGGILPARIHGEDAWVKHIHAGDVAVMVGGLIGKDGIHGATFSSLALDESSPTSAVQIGEPITQKKMSDFLLEARDRGLYKGITDNGAGGLSSSLGEMARDSGGIRIDLDGCPLKYHGLAAWEILLSESQERMSLAVAPDKLDAFLELARRRGVEANAVGRFTEDGRVDVTHRDTLVASLSLDFLHDGLPQMTIPAHWPARAAPAATAAAAEGAPASSDPESAALALHDELLSLLSDPNIGSKEPLVRQYDHEVQGGSIVKPQCGANADAPSDGAVIRPRYDSDRGISVTHGICPRRSDADTHEMAVAAVDEAVRAHVALGGDPEQMAALDNFCWPDPVLSDSTPDGPYKMAQLVRACRGLSEACTAYRLPLISGKDSMKNDARMGGRKVSIRPTLLVSLMGIVPDVTRALTTHFKRAGDRVLLVGDAAGAAPLAADGFRTDSAERRFELYTRLHRAAVRGLLASAHDVSDGGLAVAIAEAAIGGRMGARVSVPAPAAPGSPAELLFGEPLGSFVVTCRPDRLDELTQLLGDSPWHDLGEVSADPVLLVSVDGSEVRWTLDELVDAWKAFAARHGAETEPRTVAAGAQVAAGGGEADASAQTDALGTESAAHAGGGSSHRPAATLLTGYGINADHELAAAFDAAGARVEPIHVNDLLADPSALRATGILAVPGGFSYGDHVGSGMMLAHRLRALRAELDAFRAGGGLVLGICNGFQVLVKLGILPDLAGEWRREVSLVHNETGVFEDSWVTIEADSGCASVWLEGISRMDVPIRHGEGRFVVADGPTLERLRERGLVAARYSGRNPNGSADDIAAIVDVTGNVLGMMPHPEAYLTAYNHPHWPDRPVDRHGGRALFRNAVRHARR
jgi:phosphoribosylformylglycinamidine synthase